MSGSQWYFSNNGQQRGPVSSLDLRKLVKRGTIGREDLLWKEGLDDWVAAEKVKGLFPQASIPVSKTTTAAPPAIKRLPQSVSVAPPESDPEVVHQKLPGKALPKKRKIKLDSSKKGSTILYAGFWVRVFASLIDGALKIFIAGLIAGGVQKVLLMVLISNGVRPGGALAFTLVLSSCLGLLIGIAYDVLQETSETQGTIGKVMLGLKVTDLRGERLTLMTSLARHISKYLSAFLLLIGFLMVGLTDRKQGLHDLIAGTLVIHQK